MADEDVDEGKENVVEEDIYSDSGPEDLLDEEDEIDDIDEAFMKGYNADEKVIRCANCRKILEPEQAVEESFDEETLRFCSTDCANQYEEKRLSKL